MLRIKDVLNVELQDDGNNVDGGGIAFVGETVEDFADDCMLDYNESIKTLNKSLKECGIKQLPTRKEIKHNTAYVVIEDGRNGISVSLFGTEQNAWNDIVNRAKEISDIEFDSKDWRELVDADEIQINEYDSFNLLNEDWYFRMEEQTII